MALGTLWPWTSWTVAALVVLAASVCVALLSQAKRSLNLGMASLPVIGDTVGFLSGPRDFFIDYFARYGDPFSISIMGQKTTVVINSPEVIKFVLSTAHASFPLGLSEQFNRLIGEGKLLIPSYRPGCRKAILSAVTGDGLVNLLPFINSTAERTVELWGTQSTVVNTVEEAEKYVFAVAMHILWRDIEPDSEDMDLCRNGMSFLIGGFSVLPINLPGFYFHKALKIRQLIISRIQETISKRREAGNSEVNDLLNVFMRMKEVEIPDYDICCIIVSLIFAASATTASLLPWVLKYLHDFPEVRQQVQEEQERIRQKMVDEKSLTWFKPKISMPYTLQVIHEILRIESLVSFLARQANKDVNYNGYVFRKGSYVWASTASVQFNPDYYPNPREFDPSRFEERPKPNTFMVFGQGPHMCPGSELAITEKMFLIHHLIINYSWERYGPDQGVVGVPIRKPGGGFPVTLVKKGVA